MYEYLLISSILNKNTFKNLICGLQLPLEPYRSTILLQLTGRWHYDPSTLIMSTFLIRSATSQLSSYSIDLIHAINQSLKKLNLWLRTPKVAIPVNYTSATDWQMAVRRDNLISTTLH